MTVYRHRPARRDDDQRGETRNESVQPDAAQRIGVQRRAERAQRATRAKRGAASPLQRHVGRRRIERAKGLLGRTEILKSVLRLATKPVTSDNREDVSLAVKTIPSEHQRGAVYRECDLRPDIDR